MGLSVVDAGVLIGFLEANDAHHDQATEALRLSLDRNDDMVIPASALAETLVAPARHGPGSVDVVLEVVARLPLRVRELDQAVAVKAAQVRAAHPSLKLPDALVVATAMELHADRILTTDRRWPSADAMNLDALIIEL